MSTRPLPSLRGQLAGLTLARLFMNTGLRMVYPFLPALARGLGVPLTAVYQLVTIRNAAGVLSPLFAPLSERYGRKPVIVAAMLLFAGGCLLPLIWPTLWGLGLALTVIAVAKVIYDPAMQAYVGDRVPYAQRGRALAATELSWAGALLLGAPAVGLAIQAAGWRAPFVWLGVLGLGAVVVLQRALPRLPGGAGHAVTLRRTAAVLRAHPIIWAAVVYAFLLMGANEVLFIVYGDWMEASFALSLGSLGLASGVIGGAEIVGELLAGTSVDRFGKRPVILTTGLLNALAYLAMPHVSTELAAALLALFAVFLTFEITVVGGIPLLTELVPGARGVVMTAVLAAGTLGRAAGSWLGPQIWQRAGFPGSGAVAAVGTLLAMAVLLRWLREAPGEDSY
ncbi:MAG: MFS transporter [Anaerolineales bacterium]|nr:MFS transporter [Anaerolineales bacterium]